MLLVNDGKKLKKKSKNILYYEIMRFAAFWNSRIDAGRVVPENPTQKG